MTLTFHQVVHEQVLTILEFLFCQARLKFSLDCFLKIQGNSLSQHNLISQLR